MPVLQSIRVAILDVGQADTIVVHSTEPGVSREAVVVDCVDQEKVFRYLAQEKVSNVFAVVITHFHADHYREVMAFFKAYSHWFPSRELPKLICRMLPTAATIRAIFAGRSDEYRLYNGFQKWLLSFLDPPNICVEVAAPRTSVFHGAPRWAGVLEIFHPSEKHLLSLMAEDYNNVSVILKVTGRVSSVLLTGDVQPYGWKIMRDELLFHPSGNEALRSTFLKCPHHGAWRDGKARPDYQAILEDVQPVAALVSVGTLNTYEHPEDHVLNRLAESKLRTLCTQATVKCRGLAAHAGDEAVPTSCAGDIVLDLDKCGLSALNRPRWEHHAAEVAAKFPTHRCFLD